MLTPEQARWNERYAAGQHGDAEPPAFLRQVAHLLPSDGTALDLAAGAGRASLWLAARGLDVTAADVSNVGLSLASARAAERGLAIATTCIDLTIDGLPPGPFDLACCFHYRQPGLAEQLRPVLRDGAVVVLELATVRNLERHARPSRRFLAEPGELLRELGSFHVPYYSEGWVDDRSLARIVAVK